MLKRKAEGERSPQRFLTQICNTEHDDTQKIFFVHFHLSWNPAGNRRLHRNRNNTNKLNNDGQSSRGEACHNPIICIRYYKCAPCVCVMMTSDTSLGAQTKFKMKTQLEQKTKPAKFLPACTAWSTSMCSLVSLHLFNLIITETQTEGPTNSQFPIPSCDEQ